MIGKIEKRLCRTEFLTLKKHRCAGQQQKQCRHCPIPAGTRSLMSAMSVSRIGELIVIFEKIDKNRRRKSESRSAATLFLPEIKLALIEKPVFGDGDEFLRRTEMIAVIRFAPARKSDHRRMVKIIIPDRVETVAPFFDSRHHLDVLRFVFRDKYDRPLVGSLPGGSIEFGNDMFGRGVVNRLRGIEPKTVEVKFANPVNHVAQNEFSNRFAVFSVKIKRFSPLVFVSVGEVIGRKRGEVIPVGSGMIVNNIENDRESDHVSLIDETSKIVGRSVEMGRGEKIDAIVAPAEFS